MANFKYKVGQKVCFALGSDDLQPGVIVVPPPYTKDGYNWYTIQFDEGRRIVPDLEEGKIRPSHEC